ncbi:organic solute transporter subunit alpha-like [Glandiceps talaboti]
MTELQTFDNMTTTSLFENSTEPYQMTTLYQSPDLASRVESDAKASNCSPDEPYTWEYYGAINIPPLLFSLLGVMTIFCILTFIIFCDIFRYIGRYIPLAKRRTRVTWVIGTFPVISFVALISMYVPRAYFVCLIHSSMYISVSLYQFMLLILDYYGGKEALIEVHKGKKFHLAFPPYLCCCRCLPWIEMNQRNLKWIKRGVLQVALIRPAELFLSTVMWSDGRYNPGNITMRGGIYTILNGVTFISTLMAIFFLNMLYRISKEALKDFSITPKFLIMQATLLLVNMQHLILSLTVTYGVIRCYAPMSTYTHANMLYNLLIITEMFIIMILARILYRRRAGNTQHLLKKRVSYTTTPLLTRNGTASPAQSPTHNADDTNSPPDVAIEALGTSPGLSSGSNGQTRSIDDPDFTPRTSMLTEEQVDRYDENISLSEGPFLGHDGHSLASSLGSLNRQCETRSQQIHIQIGDDVADVAV